MAVNKFGSQVDGRFSADIGQYFYMVDSNYRTAAQGWSRADGTGPLDLWQARQPHGDQRVFYTPETGNQGTVYATQAAAVQAAVDAMIDFRGDTLYWTPGDYNIATAVIVNVPYGRWLGREYRSPQYGCAPGVRNTTITCGVTNALTASTANAVDGWELGYIRFVPITADESTLISAAQVNLYWHDFMVDFHGVAENAATTFQLWSGAVNFSCWENFTSLVDEAQGPLLDISATPVRQNRFGSFLIMVDEVGAAYLNGLIDVLTGGDLTSCDIGPGLIMVGADVASTSMTNLIDSQDDMAGGNVVGIHHVISTGAGPGATALHSGTAGDYSFAVNYMPTTGGTLFTTS